MNGPMRKRGIRRSSPRHAALQALIDAGGSMEYDDFRRVLARLYPSDAAMTYALSQMRTKGLVQRRVAITASGSVLVAKTGLSPAERAADRRASSPIRGSR